MMYKQGCSMIVQATQADYLTLIDLWERSVRAATHDFLPETEIAQLKPLILNEYFAQVCLHVVVRDNQILGFLGSSEDNIEMLFIDPDFRRTGVGSSLLDFAVKQLGIYKVDVNEQNTQAVNFYKKSGFEVVGRSELDGQGNPYPLLHMVCPQ